MNDNGDGDYGDVGQETRPGSVLDASLLEGVFKSPEGTDTTRLLMTPGDNEIPAVLMRSDLPNNRIILALIGYYQKCVKHEYKEGKAFCLMLAAALPSRRGRRAELVSDTIIGERHDARRGVGRGMGTKLKEWVSGGSD